MKRIVVALGGNALGNTPEEQQLRVHKAVQPIADLLAQGNQVIIAHGNGPQVGMINLAFETASLADSKQPGMPFSECGAMSQGYIGYHLQNALQAELRKQGLPQKVATLITQVEVDRDDPAFQNPTKPIGTFYSQEQADILANTKNYIMKEDANRGYRRVVASPKPTGIVEIDVIRSLVDANHVVICVGGGGIPVIQVGQHHEGVPAVIDKDFASAKLAELLQADMLVILTAVNKVKINFNRPNQQDLDDVSIKELKTYLDKGHFLKGSMLPKVEAAIAFVENNPQGVAIIASLEEAALAVKGKSGTLVHA